VQRQIVRAAANQKEREKGVAHHFTCGSCTGGAVVVAGIVTAVVLTSNGSTNGTPTVQLPQVK